MKERKKKEGVNFINILHAIFLYKSFFTSFSLVTCRWKKLPKRLLKKKFACKTLMKLTNGERILREKERKECESDEKSMHYDTMVFPLSGSKVQ